MPQKLQLHRIDVAEFGWLLDDFDCRQTVELPDCVIAVGRHEDIGEAILGMVAGKAFIIDLRGPAAGREPAS